MNNGKIYNGDQTGPNQNNYSVLLHTLAQILNSFSSSSPPQLRSNFETPQDQIKSDPFISELCTDSPTKMCKFINCLHIFCMHRCCHPDRDYPCSQRDEPSIECPALILEQTSDFLYCCGCYERMHGEIKAREKRGALVYREEERMMRIERDKRNWIPKGKVGIGKMDRRSAHLGKKCRERSDQKR